MAVEQLPGRVREFTHYLTGLLARLDQGAGWCGVFWQRDPDGMRACLDGREMPPWDVLEALLQDLAGYDPAAAAAETDHARALHAAALTAHDALPGARDALGDRLDVMLREQRYAAERLAELGRLLASATTAEAADALRLDLAWARDDHVRATARCAELRARMAELDRHASGGRTGAVPFGPTGGESPARGAARSGHGAATDRADGPGPQSPAAAAAPDENGAPPPGRFPAQPDAGTHGTGQTPGGGGGSWPGDFSAGAGADGAGSPDHPVSGEAGAGVASGGVGRSAVVGPGGGDGSWSGTVEAGVDGAGGLRRPVSGEAGAGVASGGVGCSPVVGSGGGGGSWPESRSVEAGVEGAGGLRRPVSGEAGAGVAPGGVGRSPVVGSGGGGGSWPESRSVEAGVQGTGWLQQPVSGGTGAGVTPDGPGAGRPVAPGARPHPGQRSASVAAPRQAAPAPAQEATAPPHDTGPDRKQRRRRRGSARFAGIVEEDAAPVAVPPGDAPAPPVPSAAGGRSPRGARFAGAAQPAEPPPESPARADGREVARLVEALAALRAEGRTGEAHALLAEAAHWPAVRFPLLAPAMERAGLGADWATLLWEAASLPADRLVAAADALLAAGRGDDGEQMLRQGVVRSAAEIGRAVLALVAEGRHREARALLDACVRARTPEEAARCAEPGPQVLVPLLLEAARGVSEERRWDLVHALRVAGFTT
ncbi:hypothetical protein GCM10010377_03750 [Streptomyces viridiviolaceus]|uniref:UL36 very large tegument protein n=1 Tax=Streptomyces viridiviolaceus TaxID=68282 RepID=A0ABW2DW85_9ACTN|nr:hypothetical protein [Streptomyces viridiviolaceus]GHB17165.1 hypothetical protein GCM10010377_03750 [Streptomyces viridiviolaceus]